MENGEDIKAAKIIIKMILRARKNLRLYPANNPVYTQTLEDTFDKFNAFFDLKDQLVFNIKLHDIFYGDKVIYHNEEQKDDNLAFFFFKDGLRELTFQKNISFDELEIFLKVVSADFDNDVPDDDTVTLFWENDFQHIRYVVEDEFLSDEDYEEKAVSQARAQKNVPEKFKVIYDQLRYKNETFVPVDIVEIEEEDLKMLARELEADADDKIDKFMDIIFEIFYKSKTRAEFSGIVDYFKNALEYAIREGNFSSVLRVLKRLQKIAAHEKVTEVVKENINRIMLFAGSEHVVYLLGEYLDSGKQTDPALLKEMAGFFGKNSIPPFMNLLSTLDTIHARKAVIDILVDLGPQDFMTITKGLNSPEWYVVRNIIYVLREIGDKRAADYLLKKIDHPETRVKIEIIRTLGELGDERALAPITECLEAGVENQLRFTAIRALGSLLLDDARKILLNKVFDKAFESKDFNEKKEYFQMLSRWKDNEMVDCLIKILTKKTLFANAKVYEKKACAAHSLGLIGDTEALPFLYKTQQSNNKLLQEYSQYAIKRIDNERHRKG